MPETEQTKPNYPWSGQHRLLASLAIVVYLAIVFMGPATNPIATADLTDPIGRGLRPIHQALYLGHGYRFFAPDPGPSHLLRYAVQKQDGSIVEGQLPDRDAHSPRLLYHRWFMVCETLYAEAQLPDRQQFEAAQKLIEQEIAQLRQSGKRKLASQIEYRKNLEVDEFNRTEQRLKLLADAIGKDLCRRHGGNQVMFSLHERAIPFPKEVVAGKKLDDPVQLSPPLKTWNVEVEHE